jgi:putative DNA primase/helicase
MPRALEVTTEAIRVLAHEICNPIKKLKQGDIPAALRADIANIYLRGLEGRWGLKQFRGITTAPVLGDDGSIRSASGYDATSGLWCHNIPALDIPEEPGSREAKAALERLRFTFRTFPFADSDSVNDPALGVPVTDLSKPAELDESTFIAALLTGVCRQSLELAPGFLCDAPSYSGAGCGKGMLVKAICIIASGVRPAAFTSGHDAGEFDKCLTAALVEA